jgi:hypothetical protein
MTERADAAMYHRVFVGHHEGAKILEDLTARFFDVEVYVPGGDEGARETQRRAAQREVVRYILTRLSQVNLPDPNDNDSAAVPLP